MKRTVAMIYRFAFLLFSVWGICERVGFNILSPSSSLFEFTLFCDILCFLCILFVFLVSITRYPGKILIGIKSFLTVCAAIVFINNFSLINSAITYSWVLGILLPLMMILDWLFFDKKNIKKAFAFMYRLVFLALEGYSLLSLAGRELTGLLYSFQYYHILVNFLCAVCIAVVVIYNLLKYHSVKKRTSPFPRLKGAFTVALLLALIEFFLTGTSIVEISFAGVIAYIIAPVMMLFDWILFDRKGEFKLTDPLLWSTIPFIYCCVAMTFFYNVLISYQNSFGLSLLELIICIMGITCVIGYGVYIGDKIASR